jgi:hypothetical protein
VLKKLSLFNHQPYSSQFSVQLFQSTAQYTYKDSPLFPEDRILQTHRTMKATEPYDAELAKKLETIYYQLVNEDMQQCVQERGNGINLKLLESDYPHASDK